MTNNYTYHSPEPIPHTNTTENCLLEIKDWMTNNKLQLSDGKTEVMLIRSKYDLSLNPLKCLQLGSTSIKPVQAVTFDTNDELNFSRYWDLEAIGISHKEHSRQTDFEEFKENNLTRTRDDKYVASLPWKEDHPPLPTNFNICQACTRSMVRRLSPELLHTYNEIISDQLSRGFIEKIKEDNPEEGHYIPHHSVAKYSTTTPIRIVYDCSCTQYPNPSLNDCLETGPSLINDLVEILIRFRVNKIAFTSDIEKAFLNVQLAEHDRKYTKFLWLSDPTDTESDFVVYQFASVLFGSASSPFILNSVVKTHLDSEETPVADDIKRNIYVDNVISGINSTQSTLKHGNSQSKEHISAQELKHAETLWIKSVQLICYSDEIRALRTHTKSRPPLIRQLQLFVDDSGILRCGGRLQNAVIEYSAKHPILLPPKHAYTKLVIRNAHEAVLHAGTMTTVTFIRQQLWIPRIRQAVNAVIRNCVKCLKFGGKPYAKPATPPLPNFRLEESVPFTITGLDYTGTLYYRTPTSKHNKSYICLFTCAVTRAVHLELVTDMTADAFLRAFRRFAARRSLPKYLVSDNASTFLAAAQEIERLVNNESVKGYLGNKGVTWKFIPKRAPWFGGFYERLIGITKACLRKILGKSCVYLDELTTILTEVESVINDRPLTYVSGNNEDPSPLTPSHLLYRRLITQLPHDVIDDDELLDPSYGNERSTLQKRAIHLDKLHEHFWQRWRNEYLQTLRERHAQITDRGHSNNVIKVGDVVQVHSDTNKRVNWQLAVVQRLVHSNDNLVRSAIIRTKTGITNRPI
ncbi:uncharacterized protein LOC144353806 [Saccoglossus kowalevskii]